MSDDYFFFLREGWLSQAEALVEDGETSFDLDECNGDFDSLKIVITPQTKQAGKVYLSLAKESTHHFHSPEKLIDVLINSLTQDVGFSDEVCECIIDYILDDY